MTVDTRSSGPEKIWDRHLDTHVLRLMPGDIYASGDDVVLTTVLGSCISACVRDPERGVGGMNHFMLPSARPGTPIGPEHAARYGTHAMQLLIESIVQLGGRADRLEVKIFGGGRIVDGMTDVGSQNIQFIRDYLASAGLSATAEDLGLSHPRKVNFFVQSGRVMVRKLRTLHSRAVAADEQRLRESALASGESI